MRWILAILLFLLPATASTAWAEIGQIKLSFGQASLERKGELIPAKVGLLVEAADVIITGKDGRLGITFTDDSRFAAIEIKGKSPEKAALPPGPTAGSS